jgi:hypothetical protein
VYKDWTITAKAIHEERAKLLESHHSSARLTGVVRRKVGLWMQSIGRRLAADGPTNVELADVLR